MTNIFEFSELGMLTMKKIFDLGQQTKIEIGFPTNGAKYFRMEGAVQDGWAS